ncbi:MAG: hypothetical protein RXO32_10745 [Thermoproteus sp.]
MAVVVETGSGTYRLDETRLVREVCAAVVKGMGGHVTVKPTQLLGYVDPPMPLAVMTSMAFRRIFGPAVVWSRRTPRRAYTLDRAAALQICRAWGIFKEGGGEGHE